MGAGFGHRYKNSDEGALAFSLYGDTTIDEGDDDFAAQELGDALSILADEIRFVYRNREVRVPIEVQSTYNGDDLCVGNTKDFDQCWEDAVLNAGGHPQFVDWDGVRSMCHEPSIIAEFEAQIKRELLKEYPYMMYRRRVCGWISTSYQYIDPTLNNQPVKGVPA